MTQTRCCGKERRGEHKDGMKKLCALRFMLPIRLVMRRFRFFTTKDTKNHEGLFSIPSSWFFVSFVVKNMENGK